MSLARWSLGLGGAAIALPLAALLLAATVFLFAWSGSPAPPTFDYQPTTTTVGDIPPTYLALYVAAAQRYGVDWAVLAGIGKVECDRGRDPDPACTTPWATNSAGAGGPMQFLGSTWERYGVTPSGSRAPASGRWNPADAIFSAANYLRAEGAPADYEAAIFAYNHSAAYVALVEQWAATYRLAAGGGTTADVTSVEAVSGGAATITSQGLASPPAQAPVAVIQMIDAGDEIIGFPYVYGGGHGAASALSLTDPQPNGGGYDCSSAVSYVLHAAGLLTSVETSGQLESFGLPGPGRWVTVYANSGHTFIEVAGIVMNTAWYAAVQPTTPDSGPRWQPGSTVPAQIAGDVYGGFVQRHPAGL